MMRIALAGLLIAAVALPARAELAGTATVIDGDTLDVHGRRVRLLGVDAPESAQTCYDRGKPWRCGQQAALALDAKIAKRPVSCSEQGSDRYGRALATCSVGGENLNAWLVSQGWALSYRHYAKTYAGEEAEAKATHKGIWRGSFIAPWDYRAARRRSAKSTAPARPPAQGCVIKGNINAGGDKIYHVPGTPAYAKTRIDSSKGERYFCDEAQAKGAGFRAAR